MAITDVSAAPTLPAITYAMTMAPKPVHVYEIQTTWKGNTGQGTSGYKSYRRDHELKAPGKLSSVACSSDAAFRGDPSRYSPEELLLGAVSACHMLWFLHLCADAGIIVTSYHDQAQASMRENSDGSGEFIEATLRPHVGITAPEREDEASALHHRAHQMCFISRSIKFPVRIEPRFEAVKLL